MNIIGGDLVEVRQAHDNTHDHTHDPAHIHIGRIGCTQDRQPKPLVCSKTETIYGVCVAHDHAPNHTHDHAHIHIGMDIIG